MNMQEISALKAAYKEVLLEIMRETSSPLFPLRTAATLAIEFGVSPATILT
jgi:hypothetical protein